jgi:hypothetical protein
MFTAARSGEVVVVVLPAGLVVVDEGLVEAFEPVETSRLEHPAMSRPVARKTATEGRRH